MSDFYNMAMDDIHGTPTALNKFADTACLVVNVASRWGLTSQYAGLRTLQENYADRGFSVLAFPCNQFGGQEPGSNEEVFAFAVDKYQANFPMFAKIEVNGSGACELYQWLKAAKPDEEGGTDIPWNFTKFLIDKSGQVIARFSPQTSPEELNDAIEALL
jgi:glutathione peroxidase